MAELSMQFTQTTGETEQTIGVAVELDSSYPDALSQERVEMINGFRDALAEIQRLGTGDES